MRLIFRGAHDGVEITLPDGSRRLVFGGEGVDVQKRTYAFRPDQARELARNLARAADLADAQQRRN